MRLSLAFILLIAGLAMSPTVGLAEILWQQDFESLPAWESTASNTGTVPTTHTAALANFNASAFRITYQETVVDPVLEINATAGYGGGKGLIYRMSGAGAWRAASIDLDFADPDVNWTTESLQRNGYDELWISYYYKDGQGIDFETGGAGTRLWKSMRAWSFDPVDFCGESCADPDVYWTNLMATGTASISSHYLDGSLYKKPFFIPSWQGTSLYWTPQWWHETGIDTGTSGYSSAQDRSVVGTHLVAASDTYSVNGGEPIPGILGDNQWHKIEYHVKLNDIGSANSIQEVYIDGAATPISTVGNGYELRVTDRKIRQVVLFDNYLKYDGSVQPIYIDNIIVSTTRVTGAQPASTPHSRYGLGTATYGSGIMRVSQ